MVLVLRRVERGRPRQELAWRRCSPSAGTAVPGVRRVRPDLSGPVAAHARPRLRRHRVLGEHRVGQLHGRSRARQLPRRQGRRSHQRSRSSGSVSLKSWSACPRWPRPPASPRCSTCTHLRLPSLPQSFAALTTARATMSFLVLLVPTLMMGASLPLIIRSSMFRGGTLGSRVGLLYGTNTTGAILGTLAAGLYLIPTVGIAKTFQTAALMNVSAGVIAVLMGLALRKRAAAPPKLPVRRPRRCRRTVARTFRWVRAAWCCGCSSCRDSRRSRSKSSGSGPSSSSLGPRFIRSRSC